MAELVNLWSKISVYCCNHDNPKKMMIASNTEKIKTPFYACKNYFPENQDAEHPYCPNRLNLDDYQGLVLKFIEIVSADMFADYTNYRFEYKGARQKIQVRVLIYNEDTIHLGIINKTVLNA